MNFSAFRETYGKWSRITHAQVKWIEIPQEAQDLLSVEDFVYAIVAPATEIVLAVYKSNAEGTYAQLSWEADSK